MPNTLVTIASSAFAIFASIANASPTPAVIEARAPPSGYTYRGCYTDIIGFRVLSVYVGTSLAMTLDKCAIACSGYQYFGTELGTQCFCGNSIGTFPPPIPVLDSLCVLPCVGNVLAGKPLFDQICGGPTQISVYQKNAGTVPPVPANPTFNPIGCYTQEFGSSTLGDAELNVPIGLTLQVCEALCQGSLFYGLTNGGRCTCANIITAGALIAAPSVCNVLCNGNNAQTCGGSNSINLYASLSLGQCGNLGTDLRVKNPGFEAGVSYWTTTSAFPAALIQWTAPMTIVYEGKRAARFVSKSIGASISISQPVSVCPGANYVLSIYSRQEANSGCTAQVVYNGITEFTAVPPVGAWGKTESFLVSNNEETPLTITVQCTGTAALKTMYIDNVQLRPANAADRAIFP